MIAGDQIGQRATFQPSFVPTLYLLWWSLLEMWNTADWREAEASEIINNAAQKKHLSSKEAFSR